MPESESWAIATDQYKKESSGKSKSASHLLPFLDSFSDELEKIAITMGPTTMGDIKQTIPRIGIKPTAPKYTKINPDGPGSQVQQHQPVLSPPAVRG
jgi:hypothetical protein